VKPDGILIRYGEIGLKGRVTRNRFEKQLKRNIKKALKSHDIEFTLSVILGRIICITHDIENAVTQLSHVFGITSISPAYLIDTNISSMKKLALFLVKNHDVSVPRFALRVSRVGTHDFTSQDVAIDVGAYIQEKTDFPVDLTNPDCEVFIEVRDDTTLVFLEKIQGPGGMPVGTQGRVLSLIENPHDLLAAWFLLKRGCDMVFISSKKNIEQTFDRFFSIWHIPSFICYVKKDGEYWKQVNSIITDQHCQAICDGSFFGENAKKVVEHIIFLKHQVNIPVMTPLISYKKKTIDVLCKEKVIIE
jgi:thiamine biosynthesis protein ThiI